MSQFAPVRGRPNAIVLPKVMTPAKSEKERLLMAEIGKAINTIGGWPGAFITTPVGK